MSRRAGGRHARRQAAGRTPGATTAAIATTARGIAAAPDAGASSNGIGSAWLAPGARGIVTLVAPWGLVTGGPEAMHQLGARLRASGIDARVAYVVWTEPGQRLRDSLRRNGRAPAYDGYRLPEATSIDDRPGNVVILPEIWTRATSEFQRSTVAIWWLSVDNNLAVPTGQYFAGPTPPKVVHLHQSAYAEAYLRAHGAQRIHRLGDELNARHLVDHSAVRPNREDAVVFNPRKGIETTQALAARAAVRGLTVPWVPIVDLTTDQVAILLQIAKVYVDFGHHPGMDRLPREAAMAGCCVVTGLRGAAAFDEDVPLPDGFKLDDAALDTPQLDAILDRIVACLVDFGSAAAAFEPYRAWIRAQPAQFESEINDLFGIA